MSKLKDETRCAYTYPDGDRCDGRTDQPGCAKGLCPKHYAQARRNRLGKTAEATGDRRTLSISLSEDTIEALDAEASKRKVDRSRLVDALLTDALI